MATIQELEKEVSRLRDIKNAVMERYNAASAARNDAYVAGKMTAEIAAEYTIAEGAMKIAYSDLYKATEALKEAQAVKHAGDSPVPVPAPAPPAQDPAATKTENLPGSSSINTNGTGTQANPKVIGNKADDNNPQTSNTTDLGEMVITAKRPQPAQPLAQAPSSQPIVPQPNILDRFASYTYQASVYMLTPDQYNTFQRSKKKTVNGYNLMFQSGGAPNNIGGPQGAGGASGYKTVSKDGVDTVVNASSALPNAGSPDAGRNPYFPNDFYIDTITIENILQGKATMAAHSSTQLKFTVIEPSNITLIDCIYKAVQDLQPKATGGGPINYAAVCYLMVIRFYGYDEQGRLQKVGYFNENSSLTDPNAAIEKYIPFRIKNINWEVSSRLVMYEFDCQPIGQIIAGGTRRGTIPADVEISGQTVGELLVGSVPPSNAPATSGLRSDENQSPAETKRLSGQSTPPPKASAAQQKSAQRTGLVGAMNAEQQKRVKSGEYEIADEYEIVFAKGAEKIRDATLIKPGKDLNKGATDMGPAPQQNPSGMSPDKGSVNSNSRNQGITAGMQMLQAIDVAIRNSNYITDQATTVISEGSDGKSEANGSQNTNSFTWYFPVMSVEQLGYDNKRNDFAYRVKYTILPYAPQDFQSQYFALPKYRGVVKSYPYWFTGQNTAVLDYRANFNHLYVQTVSGSSVENSALAQSRKNFLSSTREMHFVQYQARSTESAQGANGRANEIAANAAEYLYNPADNGQGEITIVGDPAWLQQGSAVGEIDPNNVNYSPFNPDGTINFDTNDVLFEIVWQRPEDYSLNSGLADPYARTQAIFGDREPRQSVIYRATNISSEFRQGRFTQKVKGVLYRYQTPGQKTKNEGLDDSGRQNASTDPRVIGRSNQTPSTQLRTGLDLPNTAGAGRGVVGGPTAEELASQSDSKSAQTTAASLSSAATPSARLAPAPNVTATPTGSGEFSAAPPTPADTTSTLKPASPVSSNGEVVELQRTLESQINIKNELYKKLREVSDRYTTAVANGTMTKELAAEKNLAEANWKAASSDAYKTQTAIQKATEAQQGARDY